jgi:hypothetical protein
LAAFRASEASKARFWGFTFKETPGEVYQRGIMSQVLHVGYSLLQSLIELILDNVQVSAEGGANIAQVLSLGPMMNLP